MRLVESMHISNRSLTNMVGPHLGNNLRMASRPRRMKVERRHTPFCLSLLGSY
jgi:hypothetical protein